jgi:hypothetical protein
MVHARPKRALHLGHHYISRHRLWTEKFLDFRPLLETSLVFVRLDHVARFIVNADHCVM